MKKGDSRISRRDLLKSAAMAGATLGLADLISPPTPAEESIAGAPPDGSVIGMKFEPRPTIRVGVIGVGGRGTSMLTEFLGVDGVEITAVCDIVKDKCVNAQRVIEKAGQKSPAQFFRGDHDFENLCKRDDVDFIYIATPWDWHVSMAIAAMKNGKHTGVEVPAATTLKDCWALVDTSEKTRRHCIMMENCCYGENEMMVLNMVRAAVFGELLHGEAAYIHDLRSLLLSDKGEGLWRRFPHVTRDGNLYPTHGLGPVAQYMDINRGDRFDYLVSMSSLSISLAEYRE
ncbi:MAG TPA: Gfo/Idh/MocA family oxidoreductase, partial [Blastocatellia bacterium]|nr:Gfo/Idh/MocA family oxidoreductase [Blastocatellia bacterium]